MAQLDGLGRAKVSPDQKVSACVYCTEEHALSFMICPAFTCKAHAIRVHNRYASVRVAPSLHNGERGTGAADADGG